jgi:threonine dehydratase
VDPIVSQINNSLVYDVSKVTALDHAKKLSDKLNNAIYFKREDLQPVKSFKIRGAYNRIAQLSDNEKKAGVIAASAGNHAQGVALSAQKLGIEATIIMPTTTPQIKIDAVRSYGAEVVLFGDSYSDAGDYAKELQKNRDMIYVHPFNDLEVIAGQGTIGKEIVEQLTQVDYIFVPVGGGGLLAGIASYVKNIKPNCNIIGVEPIDSNVMNRSLKEGKIAELKSVGIFADGVAVKVPGDNTYELCSKYVDEMMTVSTDEICAAIKNIYEDSRSIVEPAGALAMAGATRFIEKNSLKNKNIVVINSGANMTFERLQFIAERTLVGSGKEVLYSIELAEKPGALRGLVENVVNGYSISEFNYRKQDIKKAHIFVGMLLVEPEDKLRLETSLNKYNYKFKDLTSNEISKRHLRHMIGGKAPKGTNEALFEFVFPERPGALHEFLIAIEDRYNVSLFHYRNNGGDNARVMIGLEGHSIKLDLPDGFEKHTIAHNTFADFI